MPDDTVRAVVKALTPVATLRVVLLSEKAGINADSVDVVEVAPSFDNANAITAIMAGRLIVNILGASWGADGGCRARTL